MRCGTRRHGAWTFVLEDAATRQAQVADGAVVDMTALSHIGETTPSRPGETPPPRSGAAVPQWVTVGAGARWSDVLSVVLDCGFTPPVLTDYLEITVGGTLSAGGVGGTSFRYGPQTRHVLALQVATPEGDLVTCSPTDRPGLFTRALGGMGRHGVITEATIRLVEAPKLVHRVKLPFPDVTSLAAAQRRLVAEAAVDHLQGHILAGPDGRLIRLDTATFDRPPTWAIRHTSDPAASAGIRQSVTGSRRAGDGSGDHLRDPSGAGGPRTVPDSGARLVEVMTYADFARRMDADVVLMKRMGQWEWAHPWWAAFVPDHAAEALTEGLMAELTPDTLGKSGVVLFYPVAGRGFLLAVLRAAPPYERELVRKMVAHNDRLTRQMWQAGGTVYEIGQLTSSPA